MKVIMSRKFLNWWPGCSSKFQQYKIRIAYSIKVQFDLDLRNLNFCLDQLTINLQYKMTHVAISFAMTSLIRVGAQLAMTQIKFFLILSLIVKPKLTEFCGECQVVNSEHQEITSSMHSGPQHLPQLSSSLGTLLLWTSFCLIIS